MYKLICLIALAFVAMTFNIQDNTCPEETEFKCLGDINKGIYQKYS